MRTINATVGSIPNLLIQLGTQGEHNSTRIVIDYTEWIDDDFAGYPTIECVSPAGYLYNVAVSVETIGDKSRIIWLISEDDTAECGKGTMRVVMHRSDGSIIRSATCRTVVLEGLSAVERPDRYDDWIAELSRLSSGITSASADAINAAAAAKVFAESAASINEHASYIDTAMNIFVPVSGWKLNSAGKWQYVISNVLITSNVFADINLDDSAELLNSMIEAETGNGTLTLTTAVKPDGDLNGTAQLCGRIRAYFDQDFKTYMDSKLQAKQDVISDLSIIRARANQGMIAYTNLTTSPAYSIETDDINAWNDKQNKLTAGENIVIDGDTISATVESVTSSTIVSALGYTPADDSDITGVNNTEHTATSGQVWTASEDGAGWEDAPDAPVKGVQVAGADLTPDANGKVNIPGFKLLTTINFTENANSFYLDTIDGNPINLKAMAVIMNRIGDGSSPNTYHRTLFKCTTQTGSENVKTGYFQMAGSLGNCWYTKAEISGDLVDVECAAMGNASKAQISNGVMNNSVAKIMSWRDMSADKLPIRSINGINIELCSYPVVTTGSTMWIYGKE